MKLFKSTLLILTLIVTNSSYAYDVLGTHKNEIIKLLNKWHKQDENELIIKPKSNTIEFIFGKDSMITGTFHLNNQGYATNIFIQYKNCNDCFIEQYNKIINKPYEWKSKDEINYYTRTRMQYYPHDKKEYAIHKMKVHECKEENCISTIEFNFILLTKKEFNNWNRKLIPNDKF